MESTNPQDQSPLNLSTDDNPAIGAGDTTSSPPVPVITTTAASPTVEVKEPRFFSLTSSAISVAAAPSRPDQDPPPPPPSSSSSIAPSARVSNPIRVSTPQLKVSRDLEVAAGVLKGMQAQGQLLPSSLSLDGPPAQFGAGSPM